MTTVELVCLDLDGCLIDSTEAITVALTTALREHGVPTPPPAALRWCVGPPLHDSLRELLPEDRDGSLLRTCIATYRSIYARTWSERTRVVEGIPEVLDALTATGRRLAVVTTKPRPMAERIVADLGLAGHFQAVHAPDPDHGTEPKRETLARALIDLAPRRPRSTVMVGDRSHDIVAGIACGTGTVGVTWGAGDRVELQRAGADHIVDAPARLLALLTRRCGMPPEAGGSVHLL